MSWNTDEDYGLWEDCPDLASTAWGGEAAIVGATIQLDDEKQSWRGEEPDPIRAFERELEKVVKKVVVAVVQRFLLDDPTIPNRDEVFLLYDDRSNGTKVYGNSKASGDTFYLIAYKT